MIDYKIYKPDNSAETIMYSEVKGVVIAVRKTISSWVLQARNNTEHLFVQNKLNGNQYIFVTAYTSSTNSFEHYVEFGDDLEILSAEVS